MASTATTTSNIDNASAVITARGSVLVDVSVSGINGHTVLLQRSFDGGSNWKTVETFTADDEGVMQNGSAKDVRLILTEHGTGDVTMTLRAGNQV